MLSAVALACGPTVSEPPKEGQDDIATALAALPEAEVLQSTADGVPMYIRGELGKVGDAQMDDDTSLRPNLAPVLATMRLHTDDMEFRKLNVDENGARHFRYRQRFNGLEVIGGDLAVHVDVKGAIYAVNGAARGDLSPDLGSQDIGESAAVARIRADSRYSGMSASTPREVYIITEAGSYKAYEIVVEGSRGLDPVRDKVYVDVDSGAIVAVHPEIHYAKNRRVHSANNGTSLPGTLRRSEGQGATGDLDVDAAYNNSGSTYDFYNNKWNRDSYNNAGATLTSTVHYSTNYCNAFWNGTQMVYGDGNGSSCLPLARSMDVAAHELTHAVTQNESNLTYSGESGGLNEAMSDIFGAGAEAWVDGGSDGDFAISADTWKIGEDVLPPALRYMNDPATDGVSLDWWTSGSGNVDVHYSSGIANLAFYLMSQGGTHPRGKSNIQVTGIGIEKALRIFYAINVDYLTPSSNFLAARNASLTAATALGFTQAEKDSVQNAWAAVNVGTGTGGGGGGGDDIPLMNNVPVTGISGAQGDLKYYKLDVPSGASNLRFVISGGSGDADMYVRFGSRPTTSSYDCRPYLNGNSETCNIATAQVGTYYVMLRGYTAYSGVSLTGSFTTGGGGDDGVTVLVDGVPVTGIAGAQGSNKYWKIQTPAGVQLTVRISGGSGDADLYTRFGAKPTTSTYLCRPYLNGNTETCTVASTQAGYYYIMLRGYTSYSGVTLRGDY
ncbi:MAG TPA: M4 family metallopeptidase [Kofleriaceae bacterium]|nr:M4 family metallopeptidase [Kofleriaceae bacterium]